MAEKTIESSLAKPVEFRIGNTVIDIYPIMIRDWPEASKFLYLLDFESLADIAYVSGLVHLDSLIRIAARSSELENTDHLACIQYMVDSDYKWLRQTLIAQNDIDLERLLAKVAKAAGNKKNVETPASR